MSHRDTSDKSIINSSMLSLYQTKVEKLFGNRLMNLLHTLYRFLGIGRLMKLLYTCCRFLGIRNRVIELLCTCYRFPGVGATKLQFLSTEGYLLERILRRVHPQNLIWLSWTDCPYSYLPSWIPMRNLRVLKVQGKVLETLWQGKSQVNLNLLLKFEWLVHTDIPPESVSTSSNSFLHEIICVYIYISLLY